MAISPKLSVCYKENNTLLQITDTTGGYSSGNTGGYGTPNDDSGTVTSAIITITFPDAQVQTVDVTTQVNATSIIGDYVFTDVTPLTTIDGVYTFKYEIISPSGTVTTTSFQLMLGKVRCCLDKLWVQVPDKLSDICEENSFVERVRFAEGLYRSLLSMGGCYQLTSITKILTQLQNLCSFENCNCN